MQNRLNSLQISIVKSTKIAPPVRGTKPTTSTTKSEGIYRKPAQVPTPAEKPRIAAATSKTSTLPTNSKKLPNKKVSDKEVAKKKPTPPLPSRPQKTLSREDVKKLGTKFGELSSTILSIATSQSPVGVASLESLLNREVSNALGDSVNHSEFSEGFVQATRTLLGNLVSAHEGGKLNPKLLKDRTQENKAFIRASSATTVCYRDRYFKELVMNVLQSMTSSDLEEEVTVQAAHSAESRERIQLIRDMVRAEAGLEPEDFKKLDQRLEELKKSLTRNRLEMEKATLEVDKFISQQTGVQDVSDFQIPKPAREVLRNLCNKRLQTGSNSSNTQTNACGNKHGCSKQKSWPKSTESDRGEQYKKSLKIIGEEECFEKGNSDEAKNIRPNLKHLVHEELLRVKMKEEEILNQDRQFDCSNELEGTPKSSSESVEFQSAASNFSGDEGDDENRTFLEVLKAEIEDKKISEEDLLSLEPHGCCVRVLERIEENEEEDEEDGEIPGSCAPSKTPSSVNTSHISLKPSLHYNKNMIDIKEQSSCSIHEQPDERVMIERVKSKWLNKESSDVNNVLAEMTDAFALFKDMSDIFSSTSMNEDYIKEIGDGNEITKFDADSDFYLWDFTVGEIANVLVNISIKINNLPKYLQEIASNSSSVQKEQAFIISSVFEKMCAPNPNEHNDTGALDKAHLSLPIEKVAKTFSFLSNTLSSSPKEIKTESLSVLNPPKSLVESLYALSSTEYFRDCFTSVKEKIGRQTKTIEVVKPYYINKQKSSSEMFSFSPVNNLPLEEETGGCKKKVYTFTRDVKKPEDLYNNIANFEHYMGLSASIMTVQNVSDMFLFLSTVLNDVPQRLKSERLFSLNPPISFLKALDILYCEDESESLTDIEKKKSFGSLTIQNVSDFLLTLSKTFDDLPERLKKSVVMELSPPRSLLRAITLLTSLSHFSILESCSLEQEEEMKENAFCEHQERFFDAVDSISSLS